MPRNGQLLEVGAWKSRVYGFATVSMLEMQVTFEFEGSLDTEGSI